MGDCWKLHTPERMYCFCETSDIHCWIQSQPLILIRTKVPAVDMEMRMEKGVP